MKIIKRPDKNDYFIDSPNGGTYRFEEYSNSLEKHIDYLDAEFNNVDLANVRLSLPSTKELRKARSDYDKRAYAGHFAGDEPKRHWMAGVEWMFDRIKENEA